MTKSLVFRSLVVVLALAAATLVWAAQPAVEAPAPAQAPEVAAPTGDAAVALEDLFVDPVEVGACCVADCFAAWEVCISECPPFGDPYAEACRQGCADDRYACRRNC